jgi:predicted metal-dependent hydrolase
VGEFEVELNERKIKYTLKRSRIARLVWLKISPETGLSVTLPASYDLGNLEGYLRQRSIWIQRNLDKFCSGAGQPASNSSTLPDKISYLGKKFTLQPIPGNGGFKAIALDDEALNFNFHSSFGEPSRRGIKLWLQDQAVRLIGEKVKVLSRKMQVSLNRVYIKDQKTIWGSCSARKNLNFNWRLIMVPESVMDYVIIHELCHLQEMSHSKAFWKLVAQYCPDWRTHRQWLNEHCYELKAQLSGK